MGFTKFFFATVFAALLCVEATPHTHATHRKREIRGKSIDTFHPASEFTTYGEGKPIPNAQSLAQSEEGLENNVINVVADILQLNQSSLEFTSAFTNEDTGISVGYVKQVHDGVAFANAVANVAIANNQVISLGNSFVNSTKIASSNATVPVKAAIRTAESALQGQRNDIKPLIQYLARPDGSASLVHVFQIQSRDGSFFGAYVDAHSGDLISVVDFVADASFRVLPIDKKIVTDGLELIKDPEDLTASPNGWNNDGTTATTDTTGNNAIVVKLINNGTIQEATNGTGRGADLTFDFTYDPKKDPTDPTNANAARVNGFFIANTVHDIMYRYGFTEKAFNFQVNDKNNDGRRGATVVMIVQDPSGTNNANFATPPEGQPGVCRMFLWNVTQPRQDSAMDNSALIHELTHGLTNRMTGGGTSICLQTPESGGMGEGWSDAVADWMAQTSAQTTDFVLGQFVSGKAGGLRSAPYSVNETVNPLRYSDIGKTQDVHKIGEVWANTLHNVYADLVNSLGFSNTAKTDPTGKEGNVVFMKLLINGLSLQPCNPTVLAARDAIIQADTTLFNGANECTLRKSFAKKGLGLNATPDFKDDDSVPANCQ